MEVTLSQHDVVGALDLDLVAVLGLNSTVADLGRATFTPRATTSAHTSRLAIWAVAGMRIPPWVRRSPSLSGMLTSSRSLSILIGSFSSGVLGTRREYRRRARTPRPPRRGHSRHRGSADLVSLCDTRRRSRR